VTANSSDSLPAPALTLAGYGGLVNGTITVSPLAAPPAKVTVLSSEGGTADLLVTTVVGVAGGGIPPLANNDIYSMSEDCSPTAATSCAAPLTISPLANDTLNGQPLPNGVALNIVTGPRFGTAVVNPDNTITYRPNGNANGVEGISYTVTYLGATSNQAAINITVSPVNDLPVAVDDSMAVVVGKVNTYNLILNDTDPDGAGDVANAQIVTWPTQLGARPTPANGIVTFTPTSTGTFSFTYRTVDQLGALSANTATAAVVVAGSEAVTIAKSIFKASTTGAANTRWTVAGTSSARERQTMTVVYNNGTLSAAQGGGVCPGNPILPKCIIGTAQVDDLGNYTYDVVGLPGGPADPTDATAWASKPTSVKVFSSNPVLGGSQTNPISIK